MINLLNVPTCDICKCSLVEIGDVFVVEADSTEYCSETCLNHHVTDEEFADLCDLNLAYVTQYEEGNY